jgi:hypothetical protein
MLGLQAGEDLVADMDGATKAVMSRSCTQAA